MNAEAFASRIAGEVPDFNADDYIEPKEIKKMDLFIQYAMGATAQAMADSGLKIEGEFAENVGVIIGVGMCGLDTLETTKEALLAGGPRKISPFFIPKVISNLAPGHVAIRYGAKGINFTPTSACASGTHAIGEAYHHDSARFAGRGDRRRRRGGDHAVGRRRFRRHESALDAQRRARACQPAVR